MSRRTWHECFSSASETDIESFTKENKVSTYRTEHFQAESNNKFTVFKSESHNHDQRNDTTRLKSPIRDTVRQMSDKAIDINHIFICITTRQLLSACKYSSTLAIDCTYKITYNELPLLVFGTSDLNRHFHPLGLCLISTDESADTFKTLFRVLKSYVPLIIQQPYDITHVMADGAAGITSAMCELPQARRL
ncbi:unnamed protein product, partial [Didymodactylos carnosus]